MFYTYVLESYKNGQLYVGFSSDLKRRLKEHNLKANFSTKRYAPWKLIYYEACVEDSDARRRELYLKTAQGGRLLKKRLNSYFQNKKEKFASHNFTTG